MRDFGLEVLDMFEADTNSSNNHIYLPDEAEIKPISPFYAFTLIPDVTKDSTDATKATLYFLKFVNWAIYFYNDLKSDYDKIPAYKSKATLESEQDTSQIFADIIYDLSEGKNKVKATTQQIQIDAKNRLSKNHAVLKPPKLLQLCRFFARAWFDEYFGVEGSIRFAHYISCYIENNPVQNTESKCKYYKANSRSKEEVEKLFLEVNDKEKPQINFSLNNFNILIEKHHSRNELPTYTISINQRSSNFYLFARLHISRYSRPSFTTKAAITTP